MFLHPFDRRPLIENCQIIRVSVFVRHNAQELKQIFKNQYGKEIDLRQEEDAKRFIELVKKYTKINLKQERDDKPEYTKPNDMVLTFSPSNLGKGFVFWFVCNGCGRKVRFLYVPPDSEDLLCRGCHRLSYRKQNQTRDRLVRKLVKDRQLRLHYMIAGSFRESLAGLEAQMIIDKATEEAKNRVDKLFSKDDN